MALPATASLPNSGDITSRWNLTSSGADSVGSNTLTAANITYTAGQFDVNCAVFNGSSANYSIADASQTGLDLQDFTFAAWVYVASAPGTYTLMGKGGTTDQYRTFYRNSSGLKLESDYFNASAQETQGNASVDLGTTTWKRVLYSVDVSAKIGTFYVDGSSITTTMTPNASTSIRDTAEAFYLGSYGAALYFSGRMQDAVVWNVPLDATAAAADYNAYFATSFTPKTLFFL